MSEQPGMGQPPADGNRQPTATVPQAYPYPYQQQPYQPYYGYYPGYAGYAGYAWAPAPAPQPTPAERPSKPGAVRLRNLILAVAISVVTVGAIALGSAAAFAGQDVPAPTAGGLQQVFDGPLDSGSAVDWALTTGCDVEHGYLFAIGNADSGATCEFQPSTTNDLLSQGFYLATTLAPAGQVASQEAASIVVSMQDGSQVEVRFVQDGSYALTETQSDGTTVLERSGVTIAWHADGFEENTIVVHYVAATQTLTAYVNGQSVLNESLVLPVSSDASLSLGAPRNTEGLFTHFTLYSATPATN